MSKLFPELQQLLKDKGYREISREEIATYFKGAVFIYSKRIPDGDKLAYFIFAIVREILPRGAKREYSVKFEAMLNSSDMDHTTVSCTQFPHNVDVERVEDRFNKFFQVFKADFEKETYPDIWDSSIGELNLPIRVQNCLLHGNDIRYIGQLIKLRDHQLRRTFGIGKLFYGTIVEALAEKSLMLGTDVDGWEPPKS